ncbi:hypothetical protein NPIL_177541, partial [Nephila pilipes]
SQFVDSWDIGNVGFDVVFGDHGWVGRVRDIVVVVSSQLVGVTDDVDRVWSG